ncbi:GGDEF domain-containing protein [Photobacterium sp. SDRW27]|uniref:sensor domain-containing diguanylate cyclase n=1 Tax=Photobacterium obscurum TaxID=2829490 RepID=UPI0022447A71|nr:GGDEF domain-containing protein [Photobacterium obscurum]MCW8328394.1 GGDEF domain-containing protein [Photobacterium obscurum]
MIVSDAKEINPDNIEHILKRIVDEVGAYIYIKNAQGEYIYANNLTCELFNCTPTEIQGADDSHFFSPPLLGDIKANDKLVLQSKQRIEFIEENLLIHSGEALIYKSVKLPIINDNNEVIGLCGVSTDITKLYNLQKHLQAQANTDYLTHLANRRYFMKEAEKEISRAKRHQLPLALIIADIDHFKAINDNFGHDIGDELLVAISDNFVKEVRKEDIVGRIGGEEFALLLPNTNMTSALSLAERIRKSIAGSFVKSHSNEKITVTISLGIAELSAHDTNYQSLYRNADEALYLAKETGRNKVACYTSNTIQTT